jgi:hypothetical protein
VAGVCQRKKYELVAMMFDGQVFLNREEREEKKLGVLTSLICLANHGWC